MMMYFYDPKWADILPYYDTLPLTIPLELYKDGFLGMNMHYLPRAPRARLLDFLYDLYQDKHLHENRKLQIGYHMLKNNARQAYYKPTIHRYLYKHLRSRMYLIDPKEWDVMLMLPTERFVKSTKQRVWRDSMNKIGMWK